MLAAGGLQLLPSEVQPFFRHSSAGLVGGRQRWPVQFKPLAVQASAGLRQRLPSQIPPFLRHSSAGLVGSTQRVPVQFNTTATVTLSSAGLNSCRALITMSGQGSSVLPDPLAPVGIPAGRLTGEVGGSVPLVGNGGTLDLRSGLYVPPATPVPFTCTSQMTGSTPTTGWVVGQGLVAASSSGSGNYDCNVDIDADVSIPAAAAAGGGTLILPLHNMTFDPRPV